MPFRGAESLALPPKTTSQRAGPASQDRSYEPNFNAAEARTGELDFLSAEAAAKAAASRRTPKGLASHENPQARRPRQSNRAQPAKRTADVPHAPTNKIPCRPQREAPLQT